MKTFKYELYVKLGKNKPHYMFIAESDFANDILTRSVGNEYEYIIVNNIYPLTLLNGVPLAKKLFNTKEYYNMILECKISKYYSFIKTLNADEILLQIDIKNECAKKETEEYFKRIEKNV